MPYWCRYRDTFLEPPFAKMDCGMCDATTSFDCQCRFGDDDMCGAAVRATDSIADICELINCEWRFVCWTC